MSFIKDQQLINDTVQRKYDNVKDKTTLLNEKNYSIYLSFKRNEFEDMVLKKGYQSKKLWNDYITWEENNGNISKCRNLLRRAILKFNDDYYFYLKSISFELKIGNLKEVRSLFDYTLSIFPDIDFIWKKYINLEINLENYKKVRNIFKRWISRSCSTKIWSDYLNFEKKYGDNMKIRQLYMYLISTFNDYCFFNDAINFEILNGNLKSIRVVYSKLLYKLTPTIDNIILLLKIANIENYVAETVRAKLICDTVKRIVFSNIKLFLNHGKEIAISELINKESKMLVQDRIKLVSNINNKQHIVLNLLKFYEIEFKFGTINSFYAIIEKSLELLYTSYLCSDYKLSAGFWVNILLIFFILKFNNLAYLILVMITKISVINNKIIEEVFY
mmetsp:Transcript_33761/g.81814  ORF Transcript_33761/g.81814 Transcript_33761/m.81814 type:complete len:388 (+) Transcript_33761:2636-3799(+)